MLMELVSFSWMQHACEGAVDKQSTVYKCCIHSTLLHLKLHRIKLRYSATPF